MSLVVPHQHQLSSDVQVSLAVTQFVQFSENLKNARNVSEFSLLAPYHHNRAHTRSGKPSTIHDAKAKRISTEGIHQSYRIGEDAEASAHGTNDQRLFEQAKANVGPGKGENRDQKTRIGSI